MKKSKHILSKTLKIIFILYAIFLIFLYFFQEHLIFFPQKLTQNYTFTFQQNFEEINITTEDKTTLNGLLFKTENSKGLVFYLHGNAGNLGAWGNVAKTYTSLNYDVFILDYRGYGKSNGKINNQEQLFNDNQLFYNELLKRYKEQNIIILGYSIGTGFAAKLASDNNPKSLILQAPYYSLKDVVHHVFPVIPSFILKYKLETNKYLNKCTMPITIFHGNKDEVIYYESSVKLKTLFPETTLITLDNQGHNGVTDNLQYKKAIKNMLD